MRTTRDRHGLTCLLGCLVLMVGCGGGGGGGTPATQEPLPQVAPDAPTAVEAESLSAASVRVTWSDGSNNEAGFRLERSEEAGPFQHVRDLPADITGYVDRALDPTTRYAYRVRAYNAAGASAWAPPDGTGIGGGSPQPGLGRSASALTADRVLFRYEMDVPSFATLGNFQVRLRSTGALSSSAVFIQEATDWGFTQNVQTFQYTTALPIIQLITGKQPGTYYYRGGGGVGQSFAISAPKAVVVGAQTATIFATYDNTIVWDSENAFTNTVFDNDLLAVGNNYWGGDISSLMINQSLVWFDLDTLIGSATVKRATLRLRAIGLAGDFDTEYRCTAVAEAWDPSRVTGATEPGHYSTPYTDRSPPTASQAGVSFIEFDVTAIVSGWVDGTIPNFGFKLFDTSTELPTDTRLRMTLFESVEFNTGFETRPQLIVEFEPR